MSGDRKRIVIVGGVACGPKAAARARRCNSNAEIILIERGHYLSFAGCGLPYFIGGAVPEMNGLMTTPFGIVRDGEFFQSFKDITVRTGTLAESIDRAKQTLQVKDLESGEREEIPYDRLVLATGARPATLPVPGADLGRVFSLHVPGDALQIRKLIEEGDVDSAVLIGGGRVSLEAAEALFAHALDSTVVEPGHRLLPGALDPEMSALVENELREQTRQLDKLNADVAQAEAQQNEFEKQDKPRLDEIQRVLRLEKFAPDARDELATIDAELKEIGYDAAAHDDTRNAEEAARTVDDEYRLLERAQAANEPLEREIADLNIQIGELSSQIEQQETAYTEAIARLAAEEADAPDLRSAQRDLLDMQEKENQLRMEVGAAQQKVLVLGDLKERRLSLETEREILAKRIGQFKQLETAFGKDGVPALLIEQALPTIEMRANDILDRLSGGEMSISFETQRELKTSENLKETLDIQIRDRVGIRDYEMFSGGEAFRVNFAIRLALSEMLAQRAGARLQTLVIDEGFGSQDEIGRQRLLEAINLVKADFAKILVITHIDELKDAFQVRIEVEKTERGSIVHVI